MGKLGRTLALFGKNLANIVYLHGIALRRNGINVEAFIGQSSESDFPEWVHFKKERLSVLEKLSLVRFVASRYKYIQCYSGTSPYMQFVHDNYTVYASSHAITLSYLQKRPIFGLLMKRSLEKAKFILYADYAHKLVFEQWGLEHKTKPIRQPFPIEKWRFTKRKRSIFFLPSRLDKEDKDNERVLKAYLGYKREGGDVPLYVVDWGPHAKEYKRKYSKVEGVKFLPMLNREKLKELYERSLLVFDRFNEDQIIGLIPIEAWASGANVVSWVNIPWYTKQYGETPPIFNAREVEDLKELMWKAQDKKRLFSATYLREFVKKHHRPEKIGKEMVRVYGEIGWEELLG